MPFAHQDVLEVRQRRVLQKAEFSFVRSRVVVKPTSVQRINISAKPIAGVRFPGRKGQVCADK